MTRTSAKIPVDLTNPGQVFACLGFMEAGEVLCGGAEAHFELTSPESTFVLAVRGHDEPIEAVIDFLANANVREIQPRSTTFGEDESGTEDESDDAEENVDAPEEADQCDDGNGRLLFPAAGTLSDNAYPICLERGGVSLDVSHWADGSSRETFKLYSGNRSGADITWTMLAGTRKKPRKNQTIGDLETDGVAQLWQRERDRMVKDPFSVLTPLLGTFNFDPRKGWTALDAGYSPNKQSHDVKSSPLVEILAPIGLEHVRPREADKKHAYRYVVWGEPLPAILARVAFQGALPSVQSRSFCFALNHSGKNKNVTFSTEEIG